MFLKRGAAMKMSRRKTYFIKGGGQGKLIANFLTLIFIGGIAFTTIFSFLAVDTFTFLYKTYDLQPGKTSFFLLKEIIKEQWLIIILGAAVIIITAIFLTHRFAGPIFRFEKTLSEMINGNLDIEIRLRKKDECKDLARLINQFNNQLSSNIIELKQLSENIEKSLSEISQSIPPEKKDDLPQIENLRGFNGRFMEILASYKVKKIE